MRRGLAVSLALASIVGACGGSDDDEAPPPGRGVSANAAAAPTGEGEEPGDPLVPPAEDRRVRLSDYDPAADPPAREVEEIEAAPEGSAPARDLSAELRERVGDPSPCLSGLDDLPNEVRISVEATVVGTGVITRSYVSGGGLPDRALDCMRGRLDAARLRAPVEGAPRTVRTTLTLRRQSPDDD